ncbi:H-NS family nucleoid-associated regulatory protein [Burkholderia vietnamiensis]|uniref:H-NS histone family protein n=1 Tax=Burkholderia vietnamiensis TaxID=60552 RepID=UPI0009BECE91|nr:H-NS histone family protein [Burkholderia vietnamiensis]
MPSLKELLDQRAKLDAKIKEAKDEARAAVIADIMRLIAEHGITHRDIFGRQNSRSRAKPPAKYRNPETGETWSGRGREPAWIAGRDRTRYLISTLGE